jgi:hypothetical protein
LLADEQEDRDYEQGEPRRPGRRLVDRDQRDSEQHQDDADQPSRCVRRRATATSIMAHGQADAVHLRQNVNESMLAI